MVVLSGICISSIPNVAPISQGKRLINYTLCHCMPDLSCYHNEGKFTFARVSLSFQMNNIIIKLKMKNRWQGKLVA